MTPAPPYEGRREMRPIHGTLMLILVVLTALLATEVLRAAPASAAQVPPVLAVNEQNLDVRTGRINVGLPNVDAAGNLKVSEQNVDAGGNQKVTEQNVDAAGNQKVSVQNVDTAGNLKVSEQNLPSPYQVTVSGTIESNEIVDCADLAVPAGKRLELRYVAIAIESFDSVHTLEGFVRLRTAAPADIVRDAPIPMMFLGVPYAGETRDKNGAADVLFFKSGNDTSKLQLCLVQRGGLIDASYRGVATGWLHDL